MNTTAAHDVADRIHQVWGGRGPAVVAWVEELAELDEDVARQALNRLKRTSDGCPSIARFHAAYNEVRSELRPEHRPVACELCDDTGIDTTQERWLIIGTPDDEAAGTALVYSQPVPCRCTAGQRRVTQFARENAGKPPITRPHRFTDQLDLRTDGPTAAELQRAAQQALSEEF